MQVSELFTRLSYGVFSNLSIGMEGTGDIAEDKKPKVITYLNDALTQLYSRFVLREADILIAQDAGIRYYKLTPENALSNPSPAPGQVLYIIDSPDKPFVGDVIKVLEVRDQYGSVMALNDPEAENPIFTPQPLVIQVPNPVTDEPLGVVYQAQHVPIALDDFTAEIDIPRTLEPALISYIAYLAYSHMNGQESTAKAAEHLGLYEAVCSGIEAKDLVNNSYSITNVRFEKGGWI